MTINARARAARPFPVRMVQCQLETDHFAGLDRALAERGIASERVFPDQPPPPLREGTRAVVISDPFAGMNALAWRQARRVGAGVVMVMDGVVEYRNTFLNPRVAGVFAAGDAPGAAFLRPAPADVVACCGETDRRVLTALGNHAVATGLPRIAAMDGVGPAPSRRAVLVATANQPWFTEEERARVVESLRVLRDTLARMSVEAVWRLRGELDDELGVVSDRRPLREVMAEVPAVITTPSTLLVESMRAGRATAVVHAHPTPLWQACAWGWRGASRRETGGDEIPERALAESPRLVLRAVHEEARGMTAWFSDAGEMVESMLSRDRAMEARQQACHRLLDAGAGGAPGGACERLADLLADACAAEAPLPRRGGAFASPVRLPAPRAPRVGKSGTRPCVVSCVVCDDTPVGGVQTWSDRLARAFAAKDLGYNVRTLLVCAKPDAWRSSGVRLATDELRDLCVIDPHADHVESVAHVREAIERLAGGTPSVVIPNYTDITYAAAMQLRAHGSRTIAIAHTDEAYYRQLASVYALWDGAVGVSRACVSWLKEIEAATRPGGAPGRPVEWIPCVAPVATAPRPVEPSGPLKLAYVGRMVQVQKRIFDLLGVIDGLEARGVAYELHMVGDGVDLPGWRAALARRTLRTGRVHVHGRREAAWVESFMRSIDVSVLVSEFEGTSVSMLEAMGAGVVPAVTAVRSGVGEWVTDGETGVVAPVGNPDAMAARLAELASERGVLARMGRAAWEKSRRDASVERMAEKYALLFDVVRARPVARTPTDLGVRLLERWRWNKDWVEDPARSHERVRAALVEAGYTRIVNDWPEPGCDAVVVRTDVRPLTRLQAAQIDLWRECGLGVVVGPHLRSAEPEDAMTTADAQACERVRTLVEQAAREGFGRIAVYGTGKHTRRLAALFDGTLPFVGFIDDAPPAWEYMYGLPIVPFQNGIERLRPDAVVLSSDAWEAQMWERAAVWRSGGVRVIPVYGSYADETPAPVSIATERKAVAA